jgi:hypothetical protein
LKCTSGVREANVDIVSDDDSESDQIARCGDISATFLRGYKLWNPQWSDCSIEAVAYSTIISSDTTLSTCAKDLPDNAANKHLRHSKGGSLKSCTDEHDRSAEDDASLPTKLVTNNEDHDRACEASDPGQSERLSAETEKTYV